MPIFLMRKFTNFVHWLVGTLTVGLVLLVILFHFFSSWFGIYYFEPEAEFTQPDVYWWFYIVTTTTVGYGDFSPSTLGSRLVAGLYVMPFGITIAGAVIGKIASVVVEISEKIRKGRMTVHTSDHTIVVGDNTPHTLDLLRNLIADSSVGPVVLVSPREENPLNGELAGFVSGEVTDENVQVRARFAEAKRVIVLGSDDTIVQGRTITVMDCVSDTTEILAYFQHESAARRMNNQTDERVRTVASVSMALVVQEALDPGAAGFVHELLRNDIGGTYLRCLVPDGISTTWAELGFRLMEQDFNPLCLYVGGNPVAQPKGSTLVGAGDMFGIAAVSREELQSIDWSVLQQSAAA